jgi:hypothetical protein
MITRPSRRDHRIETLTDSPVKCVNTLALIAGVQPEQTNVLDPFALVTVSDTNQPPTVSATITLTDASDKVTDANGILTGAGLSKTAAGVYTLAATSSSTLTTELDSLTFQPTLPSGVTSETTGFTLAVSDPAFPTPATGITTVTTTTPDNFAVLDNTTGQSTEEAGTPYTGPVAGLKWQFIDLSPDNLDISAITPNSFIVFGSGKDSINVSQAGGNNTLDATGCYRRE